MKAFKIFLFAIALFLTIGANAQIAVTVNAYTPPMWGPAGYNDVQYYYLPDVYSYYDVPSSMFIYQNRGIWIHRKYLPARYRNYDLYNGYKVVLTDYRGNTPYIYYNTHKQKYIKGYRGPAQKNIGLKPANGNSQGNKQFKNQSNKRPDYKKGPNNKSQFGKKRSSGHGKK